MDQTKSIRVRIETLQRIVSPTGVPISDQHEGIMNATLAPMRSIGSTKGRVRLVERKK